MRASPRWDVAARTHPGRVRPHNEDAFVVDVAKGRFAVIDGMGGRAAGVVAAELARVALTDGGQLVAAMQDANRSILDDAARNPARRGMGCVATAAQIRRDHVSIAHVGDARAYLASEAGTEQLTRDHTAAAADQERWGLSEAQARALPNRHEVTNDLGRRPHRDADWIECHEAPFARGDVLLLCTDGLHGAVPQATLFARLADAWGRGVGAATLADRLVAEALAAGGDDNLTVVVVRRRRAADQIVTTLATPFTGNG
ncbi:MAG: SpoIIE family protein phosphatase [Myxococcota bacterium]